MTKLTLIAAAFASFAAPAAASDILVVSPPVERISIAGINLESNAGLRLIEARIQHAADRLCVEAGVKPLDVKQLEQSCVKAAVADGLKQAGAIRTQAPPGRPVETLEVALHR